MIQGALIFMCGVWVGVIVGFFLAGAMALSSRSDEAERTELDGDDPRMTTIYSNGTRKDI